MKRWLGFLILGFGLSGCSLGIGGRTSETTPLSAEEMNHLIENNWEDNVTWQSELITTQSENTRELASASGVVKIKKIDRGWLTMAKVSQLPDPRGTDFYQAWVLLMEGSAWVEVGRFYPMGENYWSAGLLEMDPKLVNKIAVSKERNDNDPNPGIWLMEGLLLPTGL